MKNLFNILLFAALSLILFQSCSDDEVLTSSLDLNIEGLEDLGEDYVYEGWIIVEGSPISTGIFSVDENGALSQASFDLPSAQLENASTFVLTIEPSPDPDSAPSEVHILAGDFDVQNADLTVGHPAAIGNDFTESSGTYILATPTDGGSDTNEKSGVWWLDPTAGPGPGLQLPTLAAGWIYEGWAVIDGTPVSTGRFSDVVGVDDFDKYSGTQAGPPFPGEDLLENAPEGLSFPVDLSSGTVVISIEPVPDNSVAPFTLKPLVGSVPSAALDHTPYEMTNNAINTNPNGLARRILK